jgi:baseplate J-like protein
MPLPSPNLDDRDFNQLVEDARLRLVHSCPAWTDLSPGDPGITLLELFAHLTEVMIYKLNQVPQKAYIEFLSLMGVTLLPPTAAEVTLKFKLTHPYPQRIEIPRGTRVAAARAAGGAEPPVFVTSEVATIESGQTEVAVIAYHCEWVQGELLGKGTGAPGLSVSVRKPSIVAPLDDSFDLIVGLELAPDEIDGDFDAITYEEKTYRIWSEVDDFTEIGPDGLVYVVDRVTGTITFAPAIRRRTARGLLEQKPGALAEVPPAGREIRVWYCRGGGREGNVAAGTLTVLKDSLPGVQATVNNPDSASGGREGETLENALIRGPQDLHSLNRVVTARDFELFVLNTSGAVARAKAFTEAELWKHAAPGTVQVLLVPDLPEEARRDDERITPEMLHDQEAGAEDAKADIEREINERRTMGVTVEVDWVRYKTVRVSARVAIQRAEDPAEIKARVTRLLNQTISPLATEMRPSGWEFGQSLRASHVYDALLKDPGVRYADRVRLLVDETPDSIAKPGLLAADYFQPNTWHAAARGAIFRSSNDGDGWESVRNSPDENVKLVRGHPGQPGLLAAVTEPAVEGQTGSRVYVSSDCGESWQRHAEAEFAIEDIEWITRKEEGVPVLLLATQKGLYELAIAPGSTLLQVLVDEQVQDRGFYAVAAATDARGAVSVAVGATATAGVYLSSEGGRRGSFRKTGLAGEDVRVLEVQYDGPRVFLWAGVWALGTSEGKGCFCWELRDTPAAGEGWKAFSKKWEGGSCFSLAFAGSTIVAGTHHSGVLLLDPGAADAAWFVPDKENCGLPARIEQGYGLDKVFAVAVDPQGRQILAGGPKGVFRSQNFALGGGKFDIKFEACSDKQFVDKVTLPDTWLFCAGVHEIDVVTQDEAH